ncbi:hypothetical protein GGF43_004949 [Coemansia sp. RSA 2618]|nr:hypothetical protein GGF43_004949 [Coemansia sp. RSA 2618]
MVTVYIANLTTTRITLKNISDEISRNDLNDAIEKVAPGSNPKKYRIGTRSMGEFKQGMLLGDFGQQAIIYLEKL